MEINGVKPQVNVDKAKTAELEEQARQAKKQDAKARFESMSIFEQAQAGKNGETLIRLSRENDKVPPKGEEQKYLTDDETVNLNIKS